MERGTASKEARRMFTTLAVRGSKLEFPQVHSKCSVRPSSNDDDAANSTTPPLPAGGRDRGKRQKALKDGLE